MRGRDSIPAGATHSTLLLTDGEGDTTGSCLDAILGDRPDRRNVLVITYGPDPESLLHAWRNHARTRPNDLGIVAVGCANRSATNAVSTDEGSSRNVVKTVCDPDDHAEVLDLAGEFLEEWSATGGESLAYVESTSALVDAVGLEAAVDVVESLSDLFASHECPGWFSQGAGQRDQVAVDRFGEAFDRIYDVGSEGDLTVPAVSRTKRKGSLASSLGIGDVFDLLSVRRRRLALHVLRRRPAPVSVETLAERIAELETGDATGDARKRVYVALRHHHLPRLEDSGVVSVDQDRNVVELLSGGLARIEPALSLAAEEDFDDRA